MSRHGQAGNAREAVNVFESMNAAGLQPERITNQLVTEALMEAWNRAGRPADLLRQAEGLHREGFSAWTSWNSTRCATICSPTLLDRITLGAVLDIGATTCSSKLERPQVSCWLRTLHFH